MQTSSHLRELAKLYGIQTSYKDVAGQQESACADSLLAVASALGASADCENDVADAVRERRLALWRQTVEPVVVAWDGAFVVLAIRLAESELKGSARCVIELEDGGEWRRSLVLKKLPVTQRADVEGIRFVELSASLPIKLPIGYQKLTLELTGNSREVLVIVAPRHAYCDPVTAQHKVWGLFAPLYAMPSQQSWGAGNYTDLQELVQWSSRLGARLVGTLPLLPGFMEEPGVPSPYAPISRLFWNEFYVDVARAPQWEACRAAQSTFRSAEFQEKLASLRKASLVQYDREWELKRSVLEELARSFFSRRSRARADFETFQKQNPEVESYAEFRAACDKRRAPWPAWPQPQRDGALTPRDYDAKVKRFYEYAQWLAHRQMENVADTAQQQGSGLYLDLPLGVHPHGYDTWREQRVLVRQVSAGAPPDAGFTAGQDWGFAPLHPEMIRTDGYRYVRAYLRHHLRLATRLRIDHVMGLHRLFWIPHGFAPRDGVYVRYPAKELYAVLCLESQRQRCAVVGENLGTVPAYVGAAMKRHKIERMHVLQYELDSLGSGKIPIVPRDVMASLNTHDMPPFAAYLEDRDIEYRRDLKLIGPRHARKEANRRRVLKKRLTRLLLEAGLLPAQTANHRSLLKASLAWLASSRARALLVDLEDLWLETTPQNVPGTGSEQPNWRRRMRYSIEQLQRRRDAMETLRIVAELRST